LCFQTARAGYNSKKLEMKECCSGLAGRHRQEGDFIPKDGTTDFTDCTDFREFSDKGYNLKLRNGWSE